MEGGEKFFDVRYNAEKQRPTAPGTRTVVRVILLEEFYLYHWGMSTCRTIIPAGTTVCPNPISE